MVVVTKNATSVKMNSDFFKFPSTPHLAVLGNNDVRDDKCFSLQERDNFLKNEIIIEEKVDGANLGFSFNNSGNLICQNRGSILVYPFAGQWKKLNEWIEPRLDSLFEILEEHLVLFGEWCYAHHSIRYDSLPDWFIAFDVYDRQEERFYSVQRRNQLIEKINMKHVPLVATGHFAFNQLATMTFQSYFGQHEAEGVYLRVDDENWLIERAKLVRPVFRQTIDKHWSKNGIVPNRLAPQYQ